MLVLSRRRGEKIYIGSDVVVEVVEIKGNAGGCVRIGISAPKEVIVNREEVAERMQPAKPKQ